MERMASQELWQTLSLHTVMADDEDAEVRCACAPLSPSVNRQPSTVNGEESAVKSQRLGFRAQCTHTHTHTAFILSAVLPPHATVSLASTLNQA
eukprot:2599146-Rhodomonas_salina.1